VKHLEIHNGVTEAQKNLKVGDEVLVTRDDGKVERRVVKYEPWTLGDGTWVVGIKGISGGYALCRVQPIPKEVSR